MYPASAALRDRFVLDRRPARPPRDPWRYHDLVVEEEPTEDAGIAQVAAVFLTGRECPWRCVMCDLWQQTTEDDTPAGAIAVQVTAARRTLDRQGVHVTQMKLYNAGSFFDPRAVPEHDYGDIAAALAGLSRVVVESHPALVGTRTSRLMEALARNRPDTPPPALEVAMGLETTHPDALDRLHKRMTVEDFARAADRLLSLGAALRVFLLVSPPFVPHDEQDAWLLRSVDAAFAYGASAVSLIPTRPGNGALETLAAGGQFRPPTLADIERSLHLARTQARITGRLFVDLWDLSRFADCPHCVDDRRARLHAMNLRQCHLPPVACLQCGGSPAS